MTRDPEGWAALAAALASLPLMHAAKKRLFGRKPKPPAGRLAWGGGAISYQSLEAGVLATGQTGSGKSSALASLIVELLKDGCGLYAPSAKPDDLVKLLDLCNRAGRTDITVVGRDGKATVNFLTESLGDRDPATEALLLNSQLSNLCEAINRTNAGANSGDSGRMWRTNADRLGRSCFLLILLAGERPSVPLLLAVIQDAAPSPRALTEGAPERERYLKGETHRLMCAAYERAAGDHRLRGDYEQVKAYFQKEYPQTAEKTRSGYVAELVGPLDVLSKGQVATTLGSPHPTLPLGAAVAGNGIILTEFSLGRDREIATAIHTGIKLLLQQKVLARTPAPGARPFVFFLDEYSQTVSSDDANYCSIQRSNKGPILAAVQGRESLLKALNNDESAVDTLVANLTVRLACGPQSPSTARWYCEMLGSRLGFTASGSSSGASYSNPADLYGSGESTASGGFSETMLPLLVPADLAGLASGGPRHGFKVGVFVHSAGERYLGNQPFTFTEVRQLGK